MNNDTEPGPGDVHSREEEEKLLFSRASLCLWLGESRESYRA